MTWSPKIICVAILGIFVYAHTILAAPSRDHLAVVPDANALAPKSSQKTLEEMQKAALEIKAFLWQYPQMDQAFGKAFVTTHWQDLHQAIGNLLAQTTDYNRGRIVELLFSQDHLDRIRPRKVSWWTYLLTKLGWSRQKKPDFFTHLGFYTTVLAQERRLGLQLLEGILEGFEKGVVDIGLPVEQQSRILGFCRKYHVFSLPLYGLYERQGDEGLAYCLRFSQKILKDEVGKEEVEELVNHYSQQGLNGRAILADAIQIALPASGASFVKRNEIRGLLEKYIKAGDLRDHVPSGLKGKDFGGGEQDAIRFIEWSLKDGMTFDPEKGISKLLDALRYPDQGLAQQEKEKRLQQDAEVFKETLRGYLRGEKGKEEVLEAFYAYARHDDQLGEKIDRIQPDSYQGLAMLDQLFVDKDNLSKLMKDFVEGVFQEDPGFVPRVPLEATGPVANPTKLAKSLEGLWQSKMTLEDKKDRMARLVGGIDPAQIRGRVMPLLKEEALKAEISKILKDPATTRPMTVLEMTEELLEGPWGVIEKEKEKFQARESDRQIVLEFRVVKGIPYGMWGLNAGVCIAKPVCSVGRMKNMPKLALRKAKPHIPPKDHPWRTYPTRVTLVAAAQNMAALNAL